MADIAVWLKTGAVFKVFLMRLQFFDSNLEIEALYSQKGKNIFYSWFHAEAEKEEQARGVQLLCHSLDS